MRGSHYTEEQNRFISENYPNMTYAELAESYNARFNAQVNAALMQKKCGRMGLPKKERAYKSCFDEKADEYLRNNAYSYTSAELAHKLFELFGIRCATQTVTDRLLKLGIHRGNCFTPKGYIPRASKPIGSERIEKGRCVMVKVAQPDTWMPKAAVVMGYDPKTHQAIYLDGNSLNNEPKNIVVVSKRVHARLAKNGWLNSSRDVIMTAIKWSELLYALKELEDNQ